MVTRIFQVQSIEGEPNSRNEPKKSNDSVFEEEIWEHSFWEKCRNLLNSVKVPTVTYRSTLPRKKLMIKDSQTSFNNKLLHPPMRSKEKNCLERKTNQFKKIKAIFFACDERHG